MNEELKEFYENQEKEILEEVLENSRVSREIFFTSFVSQSKGRFPRWVKKNGKIYGPYEYKKRRKRKKLKEVHLVTYCNNTHTWNCFPFDEVVSEVMGDKFNTEDLKEEIKKIQNLKEKRLWRKK